MCVAEGNTDVNITLLTWKLHRAPLRLYFFYLSIFYFLFKFLANSADNDWNIKSCFQCYFASSTISVFKLNLPSFNSPKFPQPIFLPTRKFGPTMRTPEELEEPDGRDECPLRLPWETLVLLAGRSPYLSLGWSMVWAAQVSECLEWCTKRPPGLGPPQPQPWSLAVPEWHSYSHETKAGKANGHSFPSSPWHL